MLYKQKWLKENCKKPIEILETTYRTKLHIFSNKNAPKIVSCKLNFFLAL